MRDRSDWTRVPTTGPIKVGRKTYKHLVEFTRPCEACGEPFSICVTQKIADGEADSNSFGLKNCEAHRRNKMAGQADEKTQMVNSVMKAELDGLYAQIKDLKSRLALYELAPAMHALAGNNVNDLGPRTKFPWE